MAQLLRLGLVIEGVTIPVMSAVVTCGVNRPASAQISVVPLPEVYKLKPRSMVHLFYLDDKDSVYRILFSGEIIGVSTASASMGRMATLLCMDWTTYWDAARVYFYDELSFDGGSNMTAKIVGAKKKKADPLFGAAATLGSLIKQKCRSYPNLRGILSSVIRVIESIGGYHEGDRKTRGISDFFTIGQLRHRFYEQIGASEKDTTAQELLNSAEYHRFLSAVVRRGGHMTTLRQVLTGLLQVVKYNYISNPVAALMIRNVANKKRNPRRSPASVAAHIKSLFIEQPSRLVRIEPVPFTDPELTHKQRVMLSDIANKVREYNELLEEEEERAKASAGSGNAEEYSSDVYPITEDKALGRFIESSSAFAKLLALRVEIISEYSKFLTLYPEDDSTQSTPPQMRFPTILLAPDIFFAPPPVCNIIFPEDFSRLTVERNYLSEPTRLMLTVPTDFLNAQDETAALWGKHYYFAPDVEDIYGVKLSKSIRKNKAVVLPHEIHTGPVPILDMFSDIREYDPLLDLSGASLARRTHKRQSAEMKKTRGMQDPIPYLQHVANWVLTTQRYANRTMSLPLKFMPGIVAGMPALVVNPGLGDGDKDSHILGVPITIVHSITQGSASTDVTLAYVRGYDEDDDIYKARARKVIGYKTVRRRKMYAELAKASDIENIKPRYGGKIVKKEVLPPPPADELSTYGKVTFSDELVEITEEISSKVPIYEDVDLPFEDQVRPPWISELYMNHRISEFYRELLGCDALTKATIIAETPAPGESVRDAVNRIVAEYRQIKSDNPEMIRDFIDYLRARPIATYEELLKHETSFHARALAAADWSALLGEKRLPDATRKKKKQQLPVNPKADPRQEKLEAVIDYVEALNKTSPLA